MWVFLVTSVSFRNLIVEWMVFAVILLSSLEQFGLSFSEDCSRGNDMMKALATATSTRAIVLISLGAVAACCLLNFLSTFITIELYPDGNNNNDNFIDTCMTSIKLCLITVRSKLDRCSR